MTSISKLRGLAALLLAFGAAAAAPAPTAVTPPAVSVPPSPVARPSAAGASAAPAATPAHPLTAEDVGAWLDGFLPSAINRADIAGAVVTVVKDGQVLVERGYGVSDVKTRAPVDPKTTMFRPGSISKTFTWTAVMQQVQAGKIDLDADINRYLDFKIPPYEGQPITMRQLMSHSAGFSEQAKDLIITDPKRLKGLGTVLKAAVPARIFAPGTVPAYSNYGASLAGYVVERVSGEPFNAYVARHIFAPLGMSHSTFDQPLPASLAPFMATGYKVATGKRGPFEIVQLAPAGSLSASGDDMAKFMIAHLQDGEFEGQQILAPQTAQLMHTVQYRPAPSLPGMALGFYQEPANGRRVIGHAGDLNNFHSDMHLYLDDRVGLFVSFNSAGAQAGAHTIRASLYRGFTERYIAPPPPQEPTFVNAKADARTLSGFYVMSRRSESGWLRLASYLLGQAKITADKDGVVTVSAFRGVNNQPKRWREVGPFQYREVGGDSRMEAVVHNGKVSIVMTDDLPPVMGLQPVSGSMSAKWNLPLFYGSLAVLVIAALGWPLTAFIRWRYGHKFELTGRPALLYRLTRLTCVIDVLSVGLWIGFMSYVESSLQGASSASDGMLRLIQLVGLLGCLGAIAAVANAVSVVGDGSRSWWAKLSAVLIAAACVAFVWFQFSLHLITPSLTY